jgi:hypothetical protein
LVIAFILFGYFTRPAPPVDAVRFGQSHRGSLTQAR